MSEIKNTISIFKNEDKKSEKSPDYSGNIELNGSKFRVALWIKQSKSGKAYLGGSISPDAPKPATAAAPAAKPVESDLPF